MLHIFPMCGIFISPPIFLGIKLCGHKYFATDFPKWYGFAIPRTLNPWPYRKSLSAILAHSWNVKFSQHLPD